MTKQDIARAPAEKDRAHSGAEEGHGEGAGRYRGVTRMAAVPPDEQIVLVAFLSHFPWEDLTGVPAQIMMQGSKKKLMEAQRKGGAALESAIQAVQY